MPVGEEGKGGFPLLTGSPLQPEKDGQGEFSGREVGPQGLPGLRFAAKKISGVIVDLIGDSKVPGEGAGGAGSLGGKAGKVSPEEGGNRKKFGGFQVNHAVIGVHTGNPVPARKGLGNLAGTYLPGRPRDLTADGHFGEIGGKVEGMGEKGIPEEHRDMGSITRKNSLRPVAQVGPVKDVIVDKGGQMHELDDRSRLDEALRGPRFDLIQTGKENKDRPQFLPTVAKTITDEVLHFRLKGRHLILKKSLQTLESRGERTRYPLKKITLADRRYWHG